ncbi:phospholipase D-like domain-containing protein [Altericroceibacterium endophyticum]|uniref:phospholipase D-like domain-containing protein n=1 Tax=Altericroceibacterium endophyticum TaxID=1808508 RepID=UPI001F1AA7FD|nr:phospholipase D-like domain-containing protein [Altericroceibacterium endophyticum]
MSEKTDTAPGFDDSSVEPGVWRFEHASRASVIIDAEDYFSLMQKAMLKTHRRILLIGWDFDTRIHLAHGRRWWKKGIESKYPQRLGSFILWLARHRPNLEIRILKWSYGVAKFASRGSMIIDLARWFPHRRIDFKFDTNHPVACSHHQKIVVLDNHVAVCGGIDMTTHRWDTREHAVDDPRRKRPRGQQYGPWHDATMMLEGDAASALGDLGRDRWVRAGGKYLEPVTPPQSSAWPEKLVAQFENVEIGIARTRAAYRDKPEIREIETLFLKHIRCAERFIYAESQYFASRKIAEAIAERMQEDDPPEIVVVHARNADGWLEQQAMDLARMRLLKLLDDIDIKGRFHLYAPFNDDTAIYCHAKIMVVDDEILRIGSANFNNRSMALDSECDVFIDSRRPANHHCGDAIRGLRLSLLAEHCGLSEDDISGELDSYGSMAALIASRPQSGRHLKELHAKELTGFEKMLADNEVLDPESPAELFEPLAENHGLFRKGSLLHRARAKLRRKRKKL